MIVPAVDPLKANILADSYWISTDTIWIHQRLDRD